MEEEYSAERMTEDYLRVYEEAIAASQARRRGERGRAAAQGLHDGPAGDGAVLHGLPRKALLREPVDLTVGSITYYLDPDCFSEPRHQGRAGAAGCGGKVPAAAAAAQDSEAAGGDGEPLRADGEVFRFAAGCDSCAVPADADGRRSPMDLWFVEFCRRRGSKIVLTVHDLLPHDTGEEYKADVRQTVRDGWTRSSATRTPFGRGWRRSSPFLRKRFR